MLQGILGDKRKPENPPLQVQDARPTPLKKTKDTQSNTGQVPYVAKKVAGFYLGRMAQGGPGTQSDRHQSEPRQTPTQAGNPSGCMMMTIITGMRRNFNRELNVKS